MLRLGKRAQTTVEYAILIALVVGAVVAMQVYVKRGIQGRVRDVVDHTGQGGEVAGENLTLSGGQYEPYYLESSGRTMQDTQKDTTKTLEGGGVTRDSIVETEIEGERTQTIHPSEE